MHISRLVLLVALRGFLLGWPLALLVMPVSGMLAMFFV
jgi:hypothetical protein